MPKDLPDIVELGARALAAAESTCCYKLRGYAEEATLSTDSKACAVAAGLDAYMRHRTYKYMLGLSKHISKYRTMQPAISHLKC